MKKWTYKLEMVCCGKGTCRTCGGRKYAHGPYWYRYMREGKRVKKEYVGRSINGKTKSEKAEEARWKERAEKRSSSGSSGAQRGDLSESRALQVLGLMPFATYADTKRAWRDLVMLHHPDKNPDRPDAANVTATINLAYASLKRARGWTG